MDLTDLGWDEFFEQGFIEYGGAGLSPARVVREHKARYAIVSAPGELSARVSGRMIHAAESRADFPAVGDWVCYVGAPGEGEVVIHGVLPRRSKFSRKVPMMKTEEQVVAANIDTVFLVSALGGGFNPRRVERYIALAWESGASPVILLNKADLCSDVTAKIAEAEGIGQGVPVVVASALMDEGLDEVRSRVLKGETAAFLGPSGVGKSSIINRLVGEDLLEVGEVRAHDGKGRHITTTRQLVILPSGGMIVDTPGMREIQLWGEEESLGGSFEDEKSKGKKIAKWSRQRSKYDPKRLG
jgi:ribosome biogenesis GTPase